MQQHGVKSNQSGIEELGITKAANVYWNLSAPELIEHALQKKEGVLTDTGALMFDTGSFTGRSPKDKFIVKDAETENSVWWGDINIPFSTEASL